MLQLAKKVLCMMKYAKGKPFSFDLSPTTFKPFFSLPTLNPQRYMPYTPPISSYSHHTGESMFYRSMSITNHSPPPTLCRLPVVKKKERGKYPRLRTSTTTTKQ